ncbi:MAG TPA: glycosyltransferase family 9 protein [Chthoniobacterales bacterium]|jgi:ADP-heptose:LPS heptosyltransferase|nr:glycosyltransferase family 9 protein [Chthoniobacterales bacterium]
MKVLIIKLGATGDVVRTTPLVTRLNGQITWLTEGKNIVLLEGLKDSLRCFSWEERKRAVDTHYDLGINLEDTLDVGQFLKTLRCNEIFGAYVDSNNSLHYTENSTRWFDLSLISSYGRHEADRLKFLNRQSYQELIFNGLGLHFAGEEYLLPEPIETGLSGDVAIAADAGPIWPMKKWAYYQELKQRLEDRGLIVNVLPKRSSLLEHLSDVRNHQCLVGGDSLPMHLALGTGRPCVSLFTCTSPWEIYDYGVQKKIVSPLLEEFFYKRGYDERATTAISVDEVFDAVMVQLEAAAPKDGIVNESGR